MHVCKEDDAIKVLTESQIASSNKVDMMKGIKEIAFSEAHIPRTEEDYKEGYFDNNHIIACHYFYDPPPERVQISVDNLDMLAARY